MSGKGPSSKATDNIKFFTIEPEGLSPAFPPDPTSTREIKIEPSPFSELPTQPLNETVFNVDTNYTEEIKIETSEPQLEKEIDQLRGQVESITDKRKDLTSDQTELLKKYITLKETEARDLKDQHRQYQAYLKRLSADMNRLQYQHRDSLKELESLRRREDALKSENQVIKGNFDEQILLVKSDYEERLRHSGNVESQADELNQRREEWKEKVKEDLKRIKLKERELENKYELLKRDTQALLDSKDKHVLELKKKNDAFELEMESIEERLRQSNAVLTAISAKKKRLIETMRLAIALLEEIDRSEEKANDDFDRKAG